MRLTREELEQITGLCQAAAQVRWFKDHMGVSVPSDARGPILTQAAFESMLARRLGPQQERHRRTVRIETSMSRVPIRQVAAGARFILLRTGKRYRMLGQRHKKNRTRYLVVGEDGRETDLNHQCLVAVLPVKLRVTLKSQKTSCASIALSL